MINNNIINNRQFVVNNSSKQINGTITTPIENNNWGNKSVNLVDLNHNVAFLGNQSKNIHGLEQELANIGVFTDLMDSGNYDNYMLAKTVKDCCVDLQKAGFDMPVGMQVNLYDWEDYFDGPGSVAITLTSKFKEDMPEMVFNTPLYKHKKGVPYAVRDLNDYKNENARVDFFHEFTHYWQAVDDRDHYRSLLGKRFDEDTKKEITEKIGSYAATDAAEFVAEYFAYKMMGEDFGSEKLDKLYKELKGPEPNKELSYQPLLEAKEEAL